MSDVNHLVDRYIATWNETDAARRRAEISEIWRPDGRYADPMQGADGPAGIDAMIAAVQQRFPGFRLRLAGKVDSHNEYLRFAWELVAPGGGDPVVAGVDFGIVADGRLQTIVGFLDLVPASA